MTIDDYRATNVIAFVINAIFYLERNDFTAITQTGLRLLRAKDGTRNVIVWLDSTSAEHAIPTKLIEIARTDGCRIDIISFVREKDGSSRLNYLPNVVEVE